MSAETLTLFNNFKAIYFRICRRSRDFFVSTDSIHRGLPETTTFALPSLGRSLKKARQKSALFTFNSYKSSFCAQTPKFIFLESNYLPSAMFVLCKRKCFRF